MIRVVTIEDTATAIVEITSPSSVRDFTSALSIAVSAAGTLRLVRLPGAMAPFVVLYNHAPILAALERGTVVWENEDGESRLAISGGFARVCENHVTLCVETEE